MTFKNFLEASSFYSFATFVQAIANFLILPVFASYLAPSDFGIFEIYIIISTFLVASSRFGMPGSITRLFIDLNEKADENSFIKTVSISTFASSVLLSLILYFLYGFYNGFANSENNFYYYLILVLAGTSAKAFYEILVKLLKFRSNQNNHIALIIAIFIKCNYEIISDNSSWFRFSSSCIGRIHFKFLVNDNCNIFSKELFER